jgi:hypothetical protein
MDNVKKRKLKSLYIWHRYAGIVAALLALVLAVTGIALNHTQRLQLDQTFVQADWLLNWYDIELPEAKTGYQLDGHWVTQVGGKLYLDDTLVAEDASDLAGALAFTHYVAVAQSAQIRLLTYEGELIETLGSMHGVPTGIRQIAGKANDEVLIDTYQGYYLTDKDFLTWKKIDRPVSANWVQAQAVPEQLRVRLSQQTRAQELPMERVFLDLHSGRILGPWGPWVMDTAALLLMFLAISGCWIWMKQLFRKKRRNRRKSALLTK